MIEVLMFFVWLFIAMLVWQVSGILKALRATNAAMYSASNAYGELIKALVSLETRLEALEMDNERTIQ